MLSLRRADFNAAFTTERYHEYVRKMDDYAGAPVAFRLCETPVFISATLEEKLYASALEILARLFTPEYRRISDASFPPGAMAPNEDEHPQFVQVDFAVVRDAGGDPDIRLIELQGFPSIYGMQEAMGRMSIEHYGLDGVRHLASRFDRTRYYALLRETIFKNCDPEQVILLEVDPWNQKTASDFHVTRKEIGINVVDITAVEKEGRTLFYRDSSGRRIPIRRIYNRAIIDEIERDRIPVPFRFTDDLDVEWACHPNWYFRISKFSIPCLEHPTVPKTHFLDALGDIPGDLERYVLKPLYSFAGTGVIVGPTREDVLGVPVDERRHWLLQEKVEYAPIIDTPSGGTKIELRVMILWDSEPIPVMLLGRSGRGAMMGVRFNKDLDWVGATAVLVEDGSPDPPSMSVG
jgi:hypothetical protein